MPPTPELLQEERCPTGPRNKFHEAGWIDDLTDRGRLLLLSSDSIDVDQPDPNGFTPLMLATQKGRSLVVKILLDRGANAKIRGPCGNTALHLAARYGHLAVTKMLIAAGAKLEALATSESVKPLLLASNHGHAEVIKELIRAGANVNCMSYKGMTPLYCAAENGHIEATKVLLGAKANPLMTESEEGYPVVMAASYGHAEVVLELMRQGGIRGCCSENGGLIALVAATEERHLDVMEILTDAGVTDTSGYVLHAAITSGVEESVKLLLRQWQKGNTTGGKYPCVEDLGRYGETPLLRSIEVCHPCSPRIVRFLVDAGADTRRSALLSVDPRAGTCTFASPWGRTTRYLAAKKVGKRAATEKQLQTLEAIRRLLLQVEAIHAESWLWPTPGMPLLDAKNAAVNTTKTKKTATTKTPMPSPMVSSVVRRRRAVLLAGLFRWGEMRCCIAVPLFLRSCCHTFLACRRRQPLKHVCASWVQSIPIRIAWWVHLD